MRERERRALERRREREEIFDEIKDVLEDFFLHPLIKGDLKDALRFHFLPEQEQKVNFVRFVENHARRCLVGLPEYGFTAESQCHWLVEMVELLGSRSTSAGACRRALPQSREADARCIKEMGGESRGSPTQKARTTTSPHNIGRRCATR